MSVTMLGRLLHLLPFAIGTAAIAGVVHIGTIFAYPGRARDDAFARIVALGPVATKIGLPAPDAGNLPSRDPAMAEAVCRYDLAGGPFPMRIGRIAEGFLSLGMHGRHGAAFYGLDLRADEGGGPIDLVLMTAEQKAEADDAAEENGRRQLRIVAPEPQGFVMIAAPADGPAGGQAALDRVVCGELSGKG